MSEKRTWSHIFIIYSIVFAIAILGMVFNIKTVPYTTKRHDLILEIQELKEKNRLLLLEISSKKTPEKIEMVATEKLNMGLAPIPMVLRYDSE